MTHVPVRISIAVITTQNGSSMIGQSHFLTPTSVMVVMVLFVEVRAHAFYWFLGSLPSPCLNGIDTMIPKRTRANERRYHPGATSSLDNDGEETSSCVSALILCTPRFTIIALHCLVEDAASPADWESPTKDQSNCSDEYRTWKTGSSGQHIQIAIRLPVLDKHSFSLCGFCFCGRPK